MLITALLPDAGLDTVYLLLLPHSGWKKSSGITSHSKSLSGTDSDSLHNPTFMDMLVLKMRTLMHN